MQRQTCGRINHPIRESITNPMQLTSVMHTPPLLFAINPWFSLIYQPLGDFRRSNETSLKFQSAFPSNLQKKAPQAWLKFQRAILDPGDPRNCLGAIGDFPSTSIDTCCICQDGQSWGVVSNRQAWKSLRLL